MLNPAVAPANSYECMPCRRAGHVVINCRVDGKGHVIPGRVACVRCGDRRWQKIS